MIEELLFLVLGWFSYLYVAMAFGFLLDISDDPSAIACMCDHTDE